MIRNCINLVTVAFNWGKAWGILFLPLQSKVLGLPRYDFLTPVLHIFAKERCSWGNFVVIQVTFS
jgi:hypothetical protein